MTSLLTDDGVDLFIWGNAETNVTIIAASIPILRVLVREVKSSARRYYASRDNPTALRSHGRTHANTVTISSRAAPRSQKMDDQSDRSILDETPRPGHILQTSEVAIEYRKYDGNDDMYEMDPV